MKTIPKKASAKIPEKGKRKPSPSKTSSSDHPPDNKDPDAQYESKDGS